MGNSFNRIGAPREVDCYVLELSDEALWEGVKSAVYDIITRDRFCVFRVITLPGAEEPRQFSVLLDPEEISQEQLWEMRDRLRKKDTEIVRRERELYR